MIFYSQRHEKLKKNILLVRFDAIGDFILWLDAAKRFRELFPEGENRITLLGNQAWISLAEKIPYFDEVWLLDRQKFLRNIPYRLKMMKKVRQTGFDTVIQPAFSREFLFGDAIVRISGAKEKIGSQGNYSNINPWQKRISDRWYTRLIPATKEPLMELERNAEFMRGLGLADFKAGIPDLPSSCVMSVDINIKNYYILFPGVSAEIKQWPLSHFKELAVRIYRSTGWVGVVCGGPGEELLGKRLVQSVDVPLQNWVGRTSLQELAVIIRGAHVVIGNDTSAIHISAAVSAPSVCILGGGHFGRFMPYRLEMETKKILPVAVIHKMDCFGCNWHCIYPIQKGSAAPCITEISVNTVWDETIKMLKRERSPMI
ncbi:putative glycosyltransferase [Candidatus Jettenia caeni]|uniref:Putative glycosyltransferase n=1 Tax=Candidatus Jettenia caeni TaxID=247490 RepID=I3INU2_9BACT|nr:putative glycosyltransferase [Candidatus Jettenia caeni]